jgi:hypothetical protein
MTDLRRAKSVLEVIGSEVWFYIRIPRSCASVESAGAGTKPKLDTPQLLDSPKARRQSQLCFFDDTASRNIGCSNRLVIIETTSAFLAQW